jgi:glycosyltransferase involved in cell wall biosynthesis
MQAAVIISTYNSPHMLERVLWGYTQQTHRQFELLVADDGSGDATRKLVERFNAEVMPVRHVWHADRGFRKCTILNRAIAETEGEYVILTDGDCIPRQDFVATHLALREPGCFLSGGTVYLPKGLSEQIDVEDVVAGRATDFQWLRENGLGQGFKAKIRLGNSSRWQQFWDRLTPTHPTLNGHNTSAWRSDLLAVNGFDERMVYGGLDRELGERLENYGVRGKQVRHRAVCVHLYHERGYETARGWQSNDAIRRETRELRLTATSFGIAQAPDTIPFPITQPVREAADSRPEKRRAA